MNNPTKTNKPKYFSRFLWYVAGADTETLSKCPLDFKKYEAIGMTILMTSIVAFASGASAAWFFSNHIWWTLLFGIFWSILVFSIDRSLVVTLKKEPDKKSNFIIPLASRSILAILVAGIMSIPLELIVFQGFIEKETENYKSEILRNQQDGSFETHQAKQFDAKSTKLANEEFRINTDINELESRLISKQGERRSEENKLNHPSTPRYENAYNKVISLKHELESLNNLPYDDFRRNSIPGINSQIAINQRIKVEELRKWNEEVKAKLYGLDVEISKLTNDIESKNNDLENTRKELQYNKKLSHHYDSVANVHLDNTVERIKNGDNFTFYYGILSYAIYKTREVEHTVINDDGTEKITKTREYVNFDFIILLWLIRVMFFIIELLPGIVKIVSPLGQYELMVWHQEQELKKYLKSTDYELYWHQKIHSHHKLELELQNYRNAAEKKTQIDIVDMIVDAQKRVAETIIHEWENNEKSQTAT